MIKNIPLILAIVSVLVGIFIVVTLPTHPTLPLTQNRIKEIVNPKANSAETVLSFQPSPLFLSSSSASIDVAIQTNNNKVNIIQLELSFNPNMLFIEDIYLPPDGFFQNATVMLKDIDNEKGRVSFALALPVPAEKKGEGKVATITFQLKNPYSPTTIVFLPKTYVREASLSTSVLKETIPLQVSFH